MVIEVAEAHSRHRRSLRLSLMVAPCRMSTRPATQGPGYVRSQTRRGAMRYTRYPTLPPSPGIETPRVQA